MSFPNFEAFYNSDGPLEFNLPTLPSLQPTKFSINEGARNFPKEAIERSQNKQQQEDSKSRKRRHIQGKKLFQNQYFASQ